MSTKLSKKILELYIDGYSVRDIAFMLKISEKYVNKVISLEGVEEKTRKEIISNVESSSRKQVKAISSIVNNLLSKLNEAFDLRDLKLASDILINLNNVGDKILERNNLILEKLESVKASKENSNQALDYIKPYGSQWDVYLCDKRFIVACIGRQWGKSTIFLAKLIDNALKEKGNFFWISPTYSQSKNIFLRCKEIFSNIILKSRDNELFIELNNNSTIYFKSSDRPDNLRGFTLNGCVLDEYAMQKDIYSDIIAPMLLTTRGFCYFVSTPKGKNHFYDLFRKYQDHEDYQFFQRSSENSTFITKEEIERLKNILPAKIYKQEIEAQFIDDSTSFFNNFSKCFIDIDYELPYIKRPEVFKSYSLGLDIAKDVDYTVITVLEEKTNMLVYFNRFKEKNYTYIAKLVSEVAKEYNNAIITYDATGVGNAMNELLQIALDKYDIVTVPYVFTNISKQNLIYSLAIAIEQGKILIPKIDEIYEEFESFKILSVSQNIVRLGAETGKHDDIIISLALAYYNLSEKFDYHDFIFKDIDKENNYDRAQNFTF